MGSYMGDISSIGSIGSGNQLPADLKVKSKSDSMGLDMTDFLKLMVAELTNQSIDQTADTSDMLNQMVQMQMVQALVNMTDASVMSYAASLVGKQVTVGQYDSEGKLQEVVGTVTGTGTYNGSQVVFVGDKYYPLSEILAVGTLPPKVEKPEETKPGETPLQKKCMQDSLKTQQFIDQGNDNAAMTYLKSQPEETKPGETPPKVDKPEEPKTEETKPEEPEL